MILRDFGVDAAREWFQQVLEWSRKKVTVQDNIDCVFVTATISTSETAIGHGLGRVPQYVIPVASWAQGATMVRDITMTKAPTKDQIYVSSSASGKQMLMLF
jgi:hypothetical protein